MNEGTNERMNKRTYTCLSSRYARVHVSMCVWTYVRTYVRTYVCTVCMHVCMYVCVVVSATGSKYPSELVVSCVALLSVGVCALGWTVGRSRAWEVGWMGGRAVGGVRIRSHMLN